VAHVAVDQDGLIPADLPRRTASLLYTTPSHQYPTGATLSAERRTDVIDWARRYGCYVIEDDYDCDIRYQGSHLPPLAALAPDCTIYIGTFSKSLGAGLRLGYMVCPSILRKLFASRNRCSTTAIPGSSRRRSPTSCIAAATRRICFVSARTTGIIANCLVAALRGNFGDVLVDGLAGGLHVLWHLPPGIPDAATVEALARRRGWGLFAGLGPRSFSAQDRADRPRRHSGYAALSPKQIEKGIARLSDTIDDAIDDPSTDMTALFSDQFAPRPASFASKNHLAPRVRQQPALRRSSPIVHFRGRSSCDRVARQCRF